jgi:hypothetical protein
MKKLTTFCEPFWTGDDLDTPCAKGYWSIKVIWEYTPNFLEKWLGKKPYSKEYTYTNLNKIALGIDWRNSNGDEIVAYDVFGVGPGEKLKHHLEKHLVAMEMEKIQKKVIKE